MSQHHDKFKLFKAEVKSLSDFTAMLDKIGQWALENRVALKSIGAVDITTEDILLNVGYHSEDSYPVNFIVKEVGDAEEIMDLENEEIEARLNHFEDEIEEVICHELVIINVDEDDILLMVILTK